jgi:hypothetical protein
MNYTYVYYTLCLYNWIVYQRCVPSYRVHGWWVTSEWIMVWPVVGVCCHCNDIRQSYVLSDRH